VQPRRSGMAGEFASHQVSVSGTTQVRTDRPRKSRSFVKSVAGVEMQFGSTLTDASHYVGLVCPRSQGWDFLMLIWCDEDDPYFRGRVGSWVKFDCCTFYGARFDNSKIQRSRSAPKLRLSIKPLPEFRGRRTIRGMFSAKRAAGYRRSRTDRRGGIPQRFYHNDTASGLP
jgi:hypothetical protein